MTTEPLYPTLAALLKYIHPAPQRGAEWPFTRDIFVDVGAHHGLFSIEFAKRGAKVYAVEPYSLNVEELVKAVNAAEVNVSVMTLAMSDKDGSAELFHGGPSTLHSLNPDMARVLFPTLQERERQPSELVQTMRWGSFCKLLELDRVDILKDDAKWANVQVITGVVEDGPLPRVICTEIRPDNEAKMYGMLKNAGYRAVESIPLDGAREIYDVIFERDA